jgi:hypothetical protein
MAKAVLHKEKIIFTSTLTKMPVSATFGTAICVVLKLGHIGQ